ncbi:hypothetical protein BURPSPAST_N0025 [Burkholderia pseudomallei Pasteur 52237]|uniref:Uncharacterized protein n=1 Tax=Burkholderia pseudomallei 1710a TaxID=320371 RepID=A0A0E1VU26_BURPE|nr:hypothetical protein BURPSPAST_N0025 [Burkholderia pseudomallei Pasteur 52237]EET03491.1 hypothetical protein BURPS1710A_A0779 [Burkholderia pseudomallei 1710a]
MVCERIIANPDWKRQEHRYRTKNLEPERHSWRFPIQALGGAHLRGWGLKLSSDFWCRSADR